MIRYAFQIQYRGTNYVGWQIQPNGLSVQEEIEKTFNRLFNTTGTAIVGCGRTDAGVHAQDYFFHVDLEDKFDLETLEFKLGRMLPEDIAVLKAYQVAPDFHARFDATERVYRYFVHTKKNPFKNDLSLHSPKKPNLDKMNEACKYLLGRQDFTSFSKLHTDVKTNICTVNFSNWKAISENEFYFEISADRFLRNMVRAIVGSLLEVGFGNIEPEEIKKIIEQKNRGAAKMSVPAHALFLWQVKYDMLA